MVSFIEGVAVVACLAIAWVLYSNRRNSKLPPGPKGWPIIGNRLDVPKIAPWLTYKRWSEEYGNEHAILLMLNSLLVNDLGSDVISFQLNGKTHIVLNSTKAAIDLMERRSALYSDR